MVYERLVMLHRMLRRRSDLHEIFRPTWAALCEAGEYRNGPLTLAKISLQALGWTWVSPFMLTTHAHETTDMLAISEHDWAHLVRDEVRRSEWRKARTWSVLSMVWTETRRKPG